MKRATIKIASSQNGRCNTCGNAIDKPFRYLTDKGERGCIASCHDEFIRRNTKPSWCEPRYILPEWVAEARRSLPLFERLR